MARCITRAKFVMQKHALYTNNLFNEACYLQTSIGTRISRTSIKLIFTQVLWSIQLHCQQVQCFIRAHADWRFSHFLDHYSYTGLTTISSVFHDLDDEHTAGATGRLGMLTPPIHLIIPLSFYRSMLLSFKFVFRFMDFWAGY